MLFVDGRPLCSYRQETRSLQHLERGHYPRVSGDRSTGNVRLSQVDHCGFPDRYLWDVF